MNITLHIKQHWKFWKYPIFDFQNICKPKFRSNKNKEPNGSLSQREKRREKKEHWVPHYNFRDKSTYVLAEKFCYAKQISKGNKLSFFSKIIKPEYR